MDKIFFVESSLRSRNKKYFDLVESEFGTIYPIQSKDLFPFFPKIIFFSNKIYTPEKFNDECLYFLVLEDEFDLSSVESSFENLFKISLGENNLDLKHFIHSYFKTFEINLSKRLEESSTKYFKEQKKIIQGRLNNPFLLNEASELLSLIWGNFSKGEFEFDLQKKSTKYFSSFKICSFDNYLKLNTNSKFLWLSKFNKADFGISFALKDEEYGNYILVEVARVLLFIFSFFLPSENKIIDTAGEEGLKIKKPFIILSEIGETISFNEAFRKINISDRDVFAEKLGSRIKKDHQVFKIKKQDFNFNSLKYYFFSFEEVSSFIEEARVPSGYELGVITSSIAHELNNPLAGILAALDVVSLETSDEASLAEIQEMKNSVLRCRKLIETFLGFSRENFKNQKSEKLNILESFEQAMELMRFRLIELNIKMHSEKVEIEGFRSLFNPHIMTMIFYLVLGEILTEFNHRRLVRRTSESSLDLVLHFYQNEIELSIKNLELELSHLKTSKLFMHLIESTQCKFSVDKKIKFSF